MSRPFYIPGVNVLFFLKYWKYQKAIYIFGMKSTMEISNLNSEKIEKNQFPKCSKMVLYRKSVIC